MNLPVRDKVDSTIDEGMAHWETFECSETVGKGASVWVSHSDQLKGASVWISHSGPTQGSRTQARPRQSKAWEDRDAAPGRGHLRGSQAQERPDTQSHTGLGLLVGTSANSPLCPEGLWFPRPQQTGAECSSDHTDGQLGLRSCAPDPKLWRVKHLTAAEAQADRGSGSGERGYPSSKSSPRRSSCLLSGFNLRLMANCQFSIGPTF